MSKPNRMFQILFTLGLAGTALAINSCARVANESRGSETHFLGTCQSTCSNNLGCIEGQCTTECTNDAACQSLHERATCELTGSSRSCRVTCNQDTECTSVSPELSCNDGRCGKPRRVIPENPTGAAATEILPASDAALEGADAAVTPPTATELPEQLASAVASCAAACVDTTTLYVNLPLRTIPSGPLSLTLADETTMVNRCDIELGLEATQGSCLATGTLSYEPDCNGSEACPRGGRLRYATFEANTPLPNVTLATLAFAPNQEVSASVTLAQEPVAICGQSCVRAIGEVDVLGCSPVASLNYDDELDRLTPCSPEPETIRFGGTACGQQVLGTSSSEGGSIAFFDGDGAVTGTFLVSSDGTESCTGAPPPECLTPVVEEGAESAFNLCLDAGAP